MKQKIQNMKPEKDSKGEISIYKPKSGEVELEVKLGNETVWLTQKQIAELFGTKRPAITKHLLNIFESGELRENSVSSILEHTAADGKQYRTRFYNLDAVISVGYRVNSRKATQFRIWATNVLKKHIIDGYTVNQKRLLENQNKFGQLKKTIAFLQEKSHAKMLQGQEREIIDLLADYAKTLTILEQYDKSRLGKISGKKAPFKLVYTDCVRIITELKKELIVKGEAGDIFGMERGEALEGIIGNLYQTFGGKELYGSIEDKASHLLYLIIKDHPFSDGNKRIGAFLFVYFLDRNNYLFRQTGERKINDNALAALALLVAESNPKEKEQMIALISQLLK